MHSGVIYLLGHSLQECAVLTSASVPGKCAEVCQTIDVRHVLRINKLIAKNIKTSGFFFF